MRRFVPTLFTGLALLATMAGCLSTEDEMATEDGDGVSATAVSGLTVGGFPCPTRGEIAGRNIPADSLYYITTFGGGADDQNMACTGRADGRWLYIADSWRFGCRSKVRVTNPRTGRWCVTQVADVGPNICVERAARKPIIDASPVVTRELFGVSGAGWSDRIVVRAELVPASTALGCGNGTGPTPNPMPASTTCSSATLGRQVPLATCVQSRVDRLWYQCGSTGWLQNGSIASSRRGPVGACAGYYPL